MSSITIDKKVEGGTVTIVAWRKDPVPEVLDYRLGVKDINDDQP